MIIYVKIELDKNKNIHIQEVLNTPKKFEKLDSPIKGDYIIMCEINKRKKDKYGTN